MGGYSTREVSELIGLKPHQVRHYVRRELLTPDRGERGEFRFSFQDVVLLRAAKGLLDSDVTPRRAYRVLVSLKGQMRQVRALSALRIASDGDAVIVREANQVWDAESGQGRFAFAADVPQTPANVATIVGSNLAVAKDTDTMSSDEWYNLGLDLEELDLDKAPDAYRKALEMDPGNADAHVNMGRLYQLKGNLRHARRHYQFALRAVPNHQLANYNMGTIYDELDELEKAAEYYERAPSVPDAHYNLARISELRGDEVSALRHMRHYRELVEKKDI